MTNLHFLAKLGEFFRSNKEAIEAGELTPEEVTEAFKQARSSSGGKAKAERMMMSEAFARDGEYKLFFEQKFAEPPRTIQVLPKPGQYSHPRYGKFRMTPENIAAFVNNHNQHVYQEQVPIDAEHESKLSGAVGYFKEMRLIDEGRGGAEADVEWTDRGREMIASDRFRYFSPEWFDEWTDPVDGKKIANILVGGAITTRPFFKDKVLAPLVAGEDGSYTSYPTAEIDGKVVGLALSVTETFTFSESDDEGSSDDEKEDKEEKTNKANLDTGDVHVDVPRKKMDEDLGGTRMAENPKKDADEPVTKAYVEEQTKQLTEEVGIERGLRKAAEERLAKLEGEAQTRRFTDVIMGRDSAGDGSPPFAGKHEMHNRTLAMIAKEHGEDSEQFKEYVEEQRAVAKQMREAGLFKEIGAGSGPDQIANSAVRRFDDAVDAFIKTNPDKARGDAIQAVAKAQPKLYTESVREKDRIAKTAPTSYGYEEGGE